MDLTFVHDFNCVLGRNSGFRSDNFTDFIPFASYVRMGKRLTRFELARRIVCLYIVSVWYREDMKVIQGDWRGDFVHFFEISKFRMIEFL